MIYSFIANHPYPVDERLKKKYDKDFEEFKHLCNLISFFKEYPEREMHPDYPKNAKLFDELANKNM